MSTLDAAFEPRRQKLGRHPKLYPDLLQALKRGTFDSPGLTPGGPLIYVSVVPQRGVGKDLNILAWLAEVVSNCLVAFYDTRSESSGKF